MKKLRLLLITLCVSVLMGSMAVTAYAGGGEEWDGLAPVEPLPAETVDPGEGFTEDGNLVTRDLLYDKATNKQFITVQTSGGNTFYIVIDYDKPTDEDGEQYQTYFLNMVDEADLLAAMQAAGGELPECSCTDKCAVGAINTDCTVCAVNLSECQGKAPEPAPVVEPEPDPEPEQPKHGQRRYASAGAGCGGHWRRRCWYFKIYRPKKQRAAESEADYGSEYDGSEDYDETALEDDGRRGTRTVKNEVYRQPYEDFMKEKSYFKGVPPNLPPKGSRCDGCLYWHGIGCVFWLPGAAQGKTGGKNEP